MRNFIVFLRNWMLPISMGSGALAYIIYAGIPALHVAGPYLQKTAGVLQPTLIFIMMFLSFCRISTRELKPHRWHLHVLVAQIGMSAAIAAVILLCPGLGENVRVLLESALLCLICPTATAAAVVTGKLGGNTAGVVSYTVLINIAAAIAVPVLFPLIQPHEGSGFLNSFYEIIRKVFPMLIFPGIAAWVVRHTLPRFHAWLTGFKDLAFYLWAFSLSLAIAMTTRAIAHGHYPIWILFCIGGVSLLCCVLQFRLGRAAGRIYGYDKACEVTAGQAFGQKNTVLAIWMAYVFLTPIVSVAGGFYSIWHNLYNSWQLYRMRKENACQEAESLR